MSYAFVLKTASSSNQYRIDIVGNTGMGMITRERLGLSPGACIYQHSIVEP